MKKKENIRDINEYKKRKKNRNKKRLNKKIKVILLSLLCLSIIIINLCGNAIVSNLKYKIDSKERELRKEEIILDQLKMYQLKNDSMTNIEKEAREKLNMNYPEENQIRHIDMES